MHLMIDMETTGNDFSTAIVSLGAVAFNKEGIIAKKYWALDVADQIQRGRTMTLDTMLWWCDQSKEARSAFYETDKFKIEDFLVHFTAWCDGCLLSVGEKRDELKPWGNGANFDIVIMEDAYRRNGGGRESIPWKFWNVMCFRMFNNLTQAKNLVKRQGVHHNALDDAEYQAKCVLAFWAKQAAKKGA